LLSLITLVEKIRIAHDLMLEDTDNTEFCKSVSTYLAITLDRVADSNSAQCWWQNSWEKEAITFARQALAMTWDYFEANPLGERGYRWASFSESMSALFDGLRTLSEIRPCILQT
jgi:adenine-specific DNA methylase